MQLAGDLVSISNSNQPRPLPHFWGTIHTKHSTLPYTWYDKPSIQLEYTAHIYSLLYPYNHRSTQSSSHYHIPCPSSGKSFRSPTRRQSRTKREEFPVHTTIYRFTPSPTLDTCIYTQRIHRYRQARGQPRPLDSSLSIYQQRSTCCGQRRDRPSSPFHHSAPPHRSRSLPPPLS